MTEHAARRPRILASERNVGGLPARRRRRGRQRLLLGVGQPAHLSGPAREARADGRGGPRPRRPLDPSRRARLRRAAVGGTSVVDRGGGRRCAREFDAATGSSPDAIGLISWNEFSENTHVEPSRQLRLALPAAWSAMCATRGSRSCATSTRASRRRRMSATACRCSAAWPCSSSAASSRWEALAARASLPFSPFDGTEIPQSAACGPSTRVQWSPRGGSHIKRHGRRAPAGTFDWRWGSSSCCLRSSPGRPLPLPDPVIMAAGDIACDSDRSGLQRRRDGDRCHQHATSDLLVGAPLDAVLPARRHPVRQRHAGQDQRRPTPRPGAG